MKKLPKKYTNLVMPLILSFLMTAMVSAISLIRAHGIGLDTWQSWPSTWMISWAIAYPILLMIMPVVRKLTAMIVE